tara:strand:+ start:3638 stop:3916 length:279 start_codon:yes stop_codon:yes gene_type:complete
MSDIKIGEMSPPEEYECKHYMNPETCIDCNPILSDIKEIKNDHDTIEMPIYYYEEDGKKYYDFEEMANALEDRICKYLNRNVLITISEVDDE